MQDRPSLSLLCPRSIGKAPHTPCFPCNCRSLIRTNLMESDVEPDKEDLVQSLFDHIPVGVGSQVWRVSVSSNGQWTASWRECTFVNCQRHTYMHSESFQWAPMIIGAFTSVTVGPAPGSHPPVLEFSPSVCMSALSARPRCLDGARFERVLSVHVRYVCAGHHQDERERPGCRSGIGHGLEPARGLRMGRGQRALRGIWPDAQCW